MQAASIQIGELAKRTALSIDAIRFYEKRQLLSKATRSSGGFRLYSTDDLERLLFIRQIQRLGFSLREIRELLDLRAKKVDACETVRELPQAQVDYHSCKETGASGTRIRTDGRFKKVQQGVSFIGKGTRLVPVRCWTR